ncbi:MAG: glutathione S-transferase family protein [Rhizomicrobium sp.]
MTVEIFGKPSSRARRPLWVARELGIPVENIVPEPAELKGPAYRAINPNGRVPALRDGEFKLFESFAIGLYLAKKYGLGTLYPEGAEDEALVWQWTLWALNEVERLLVTCLMERVVKPADARDAAAADAAEQALAAPLTVLQGALDRAEWLVGSGFSIADLNVAAIMALARPARVDLAPYPSVARWLERCLSRPTYPV